MKPIGDYYEDRFSAMLERHKGKYLLVLEREHGADLPTIISAHDTYKEAREAMDKEPYPNYVDMSYNIY